MIKQFHSEYVEARNNQVEVLHWIGFNSERKRSTLVIRLKGQNEEVKSEHIIDP